MLLSLFCISAKSETIHVAVASNFAGPAGVILEKFEAETGIESVLSFGSSGKLYAQIVNGAPYDVFLSADQEKPAALFKQGLGDEPFTYAVGRLVLWSKRNDVDALELLKSGEYAFLAMANPDLAPYGKAAREALLQLGLTQNAHGKIVMGENISQAYQFVATGNAELGFVALSQIIAEEGAQGPSWIVPAEFHAPILQDGIVLNDSKFAKIFADFLLSQSHAGYFKDLGYEVPK